MNLPINQKIAMQLSNPEFCISQIKIITLHPEIFRPTSKSISTTHHTPNKTDLYRLDSVRAKRNSTILTNMEIIPSASSVVSSSSDSSMEEIDIKK